MKQNVKDIVRQVYSEVLFELAVESEVVDIVTHDLKSVIDVLEREPEFSALMTSQTVRGQEKSEAIKRVFQGSIHDLTLHFLSILAKRDRMDVLISVSDSFESLIDERSKRYNIKVILAKKPDTEEYDELKKKISEVINGQVNLAVEVDPSIIGGIIIKDGDEVIDNSIKNRLKRAIKVVVDKASNSLKDLPDNSEIDPDKNI